MNSNDPIFLEPVFKERIWGGTRLRDMFGWNIPYEKTGESWMISTHPEGASIISEGPWKNRTLSWLWNEHREVFGNYPGNKFPLLIKILDADENLSVQVHPRSDISENDLSDGKTECWYMLDCSSKAEIILGHNAKNRTEFEQMAESGKWKKLLHSIPVHTGDFFYIPGGTIHALCAGNVVLEIQQNSDITWRIWDWDRSDTSGNKRILNPEKALEAASFPHKNSLINPVAQKYPGRISTIYTENNFFKVTKHIISDVSEFFLDEPFLAMNIISGTGKLINDNSSWDLKKGMSMILPHDFGSFKLSGKLCVFTTAPGMINTDL